MLCLLATASTPLPLKLHVKLVSGLEGLPAFGRTPQNQAHLADLIIHLLLLVQATVCLPALEHQRQN